MNEHRNMVLAIVLSAIVLIGWSFLSEMWLPTARPPATKVVDGKTVPIPQPKADPTADAPLAIRDRRQVLGETPRIAVRTPHLEGSINLKGARLDDLVLTTHREGLAKDSPAIRLLSPAEARGPISRASAGPARTCPARTRSGPRARPGWSRAGR